MGHRWLNFWTIPAKSAEILAVDGPASTTQLEKIAEQVRKLLAQQ